MKNKTGMRGKEEWNQMPAMVCCMFSSNYIAPVDDVLNRESSHRLKFYATKTVWRSDDKRDTHDRHEEEKHVWQTTITKDVVSTETDLIAKER